MPVTYRLEDGLLVVSAQGDYNLTDCDAIKSLALGEMGVAKGVKLLIDKRASQAEPSVEDIMSRASFLALLKRHIAPGCAIVVGTPLHFGLSRMFSVYSGMLGIEVEVFWDFDEAKRWLEALS